ncbi:SDR family oxidoreductase [Dongia sp.]|uniref:SDR family oxidoreductase n=1 Tax=Dongia sp. TaxID=1977262 RepID=UPI0037510532
MPTVLITGANRGIGLELAKQYAGDGWSVIATARDPKQADGLKALKGDIRIEALEVTDEKQIAVLAKALKGTAIDVLLNNAGMLTGYESFGDTDTKSWLQTLHVNSIAPLKLTEALVEQVAASPQKKVASITSGMGSMGSHASTGAYAYRSSKAALNMVMVTAANELRSRGISVAVISPGWVRTDMGGAGAPLDVKQSAAGIRKVIDKLNVGISGTFFNYSGETLPW